MQQCKSKQDLLCFEHYSELFLTSLVVSSIFRKMPIEIYILYADDSLLFELIRKGGRELIVKITVFLQPMQQLTFLEPL